MGVVITKMDIKLYNTLSGKKEKFKPIKTGQVGMYNCGPTVYDRAHIGNLRSYVFADTLRRMFEYNSYSVKQIINVTDVGHLSGENLGDADSGTDKMTKALIRENMPLTLATMKEVATKYFNLFVEDMKDLNIELPEAFPRASETVEQDIDLITKIEEKGFTYITSDGVYFDTSKFKAYGKLGNIKLSSLKEGARVAANSEKRNSTDFALWKIATGDIGWSSPWGKGFPGWHIECSAMSRMYLGQPFDIHTGGIDHIPVHHNNEIAQSEAAYDVPLANYWLHNEFMTIKNAKMAKSDGNFLTLGSLETEHISPLAFRYWLLTSHYRSPINFTYAAVESAQTALIRLLATVSEYPLNGKVDESYRDKFQSFINDDLDTPRAIALIWDLFKDTKVSPADKRATIIDFDKVLGLNISSLPHDKTQNLEETSSADIPLEITVLAETREEARKAKEWVKADAIRKEIQERGFDVIDTDKKSAGFIIITR